MLAQAEPLWSRRQVWLGRCAAIPLGIVNILILLFCATVGHFFIPPLPNMLNDSGKQKSIPVFLLTESKNPGTARKSPSWPDMKTLIHLPMPFPKIPPPSKSPHPSDISHLEEWSGSCNCETGILTIWNDVVPPRIASRVAPVYPYLARRLRIEGAVILQTVIDTSGKVCEIRILRDLPYELGTAAMETVKEWTYEPATLNGQPVCVYLTVTVTFALQ